MSSQNSGGDSAFVAWLIPATALLLLTIDGALWVAGGALSLLHHGAWRAAPFSLMLAVLALKNGSTVYWPGLDPEQLWLTALVLALAVLAAPAVALVRWLHARPAPGDPVRSLAKVSDMRQLMGTAITKQAHSGLRSATLGKRPLKDVKPQECGFRLGKLMPVRRVANYIWTSFEDSVVAFMAPRSGKTTAFAVPQILDAPGAVVATSNKADLWAATAKLRGRDTGQQVWVFDPQHIAFTPQTWWWNPLDGLHSVEDAERLAGHFVLTVDDDKARDIWGPAAKSLLGALFMAAAVGRRDVLDVYEWVNNEVSPEAVDILRDNGFRAMADSLAGTQGLPGETKGGVYFTAREATSCLRNPQITTWVTPPTIGSGIEPFDPTDFAASRQTLYLLSKDGGGSAGPLVAALTDRVMRCAEVIAEQRGGRLDPPMLACLDEAANVCKIADLPDRYSHLGSRGIILWTILQSYAQGTRVWGEAGLKALFGAATIKIIGAGMDDANFANDVSRLVGDHDVRTVSHSSGSGSSSRSVSYRREAILSVAQVRALPKGTVLLLATGLKPALLRSLPWYQGARAEEVTQEVRAAMSRLTAGATAASMSTSTSRAKA